MLPVEATDRRQQEFRAAVGGLMGYFSAPGNDLVQNRKWRAAVDEDGQYVFAVAL
jgi:hypothetical protein